MFQPQGVQSILRADLSAVKRLLLRLAAVCGGAVVQSGGAGPFAAALRLPLHGEMPARAAPTADELLRDRYSALQVFLPGFCTGPNE